MTTPIASGRTKDPSVEKRTNQWANMGLNHYRASTQHVLMESLCHLYLDAFRSHRESYSGKTTKEIEWFYLSGELAKRIMDAVINVYDPYAKSLAYIGITNISFITANDIQEKIHLAKYTEHYAVLSRLMSQLTPVNPNPPNVRHFWMSGSKTNIPVSTRKQTFDYIDAIGVPDNYRSHYKHIKQHYSSGYIPVSTKQIMCIILSSI